jgi:hypothetical protein
MQRARPTPSPLGNLREEIIRYGSGCFLESARGLPFYRDQLLPLQQQLVKDQERLCAEAQPMEEMQQLELLAVQAALSKLSQEEIREWRQQLHTYHSRLY